MGRRWLNDLDKYQEKEARGHLYWQNYPGERRFELMKVSEFYGSPYLKAADLEGKTARVTIDSVGVQLFRERDGTEANKLVLLFRGKVKALVLNRTNAERIAKRLGDDTTFWPGKQIILRAERVDYKGEPTAALRVVDEC